MFRCNRSPWRFWQLVAVLLVIQPAYTRGTELAASNLDLHRSVISEKLTQQTVGQTLQDSSGALWFITQEGLNRYNGIELENYRFDAKDTKSLPVNIVTRVVEGLDGSIWLSTLGGGLTKFNSIANNFDTIYAGSNNNSPYSNEIRTLFRDNRGSIWLGYSNSFSIFDPQTTTFQHFVSGSADIPYTGHIKDFAQTPDGTIWIATELSGLLRIDPVTKQIDSITNDPRDPHSIASGRLHRLISDRDGLIWISSENDGISVYNPKTNKSTNYRHSESDATTLSSSQTSDIFEDMHGNIWVATNEGLDLFLPETGSFSRYNTSNTSIPNNAVTSVYQSKEGKYWVGTRSGLASGMKTQFNKHNTSNSNISNDSVNAFAETFDRSLWIGTDNGLNRLRPGSLTFEWLNDSSNPKLSSNIVMSLYSDNKNLWVGTYDGGLNQIDLVENTVQTFRHSSSDFHSIGADGVTSILRIKSGQLLIGTYGGGLSVYDELRGVFTNLKSELMDESTISSNMVLSIFQDSIGVVWVGTENGLNRYYPDTNKFERIFSRRSSPDGLSSNVVWTFYEDVDRNLWIGTNGGGINKWAFQDRKNGTMRFTHYSDNVALPSSNIYGIHGDRSGRLWISHSKGITSFDPNSLVAYQYGVRDGLQSTEFNLGASFMSSEGIIFFGGIKGFNTINPELMSSNRTPPQVSISQIKVMNERRKFAAPYDKLKLIELGYEDKMLSVEFFAADYANPDLVNYAYKLEGINPDWVISPDARVATFTTLPPGKYTLKLAAATPDGTWNWDGINIPVLVSPPPWLSPLAYAMYIIMAGALIALYFNRQSVRARAIAQRQRELETRVEERTRDLEAATRIAEEATNAKSQFLATMSHEIRTPMHGIIGMTELLLHTALSEQQQQFALAARNSGESLLTLINEILDFSKVEASKVELEYIEFDVTRLIDEICYLQGEPAARKGIVLNNICHQKTPAKIIGDPTKLRQVIMNLVSNAIKFTHNGNVNVRVSPVFDSIDHNKILIKFCIEDDGIGMDGETLERIFEPFIQADTSTTREYGGTGLGLAISRHYVKMMGGDINIDSSLGLGTKIIVSIPVEYDVSEHSPDYSVFGLDAGIVTSNSATEEMLSSHLARIGVRSSPISIEDIASSKEKSNRLLFVDYAKGNELNEKTSVITQLDAKCSILLVPLNGESLPEVFCDWNVLFKPITSKALQELLEKYKAYGSAQEDADAKFQSSYPSSLVRDNTFKALRILVAEDVDTNQRIVSEMIGLLGHDVQIAKNGKLAVEMYLSSEYSLIFMDCQMPVMDGYQATKRIREVEAYSKYPPIPIIALTAGSDKEDEERCRQAGMNGYLKKPFSLSDIRNYLNVYCQRKGFENVPTALASVDTGVANSALALISHESKVLNYVAIDNIREVERQTGKHFLESVYEGYVLQMNEKLKEIELNVVSNDNVSIYRSAHAIKSMSANIGAERVQSISYEIEKKGRENDLIGLMDAIYFLRAAFHEFIEEFNAEFHNRGKGGQSSLISPNSHSAQ
jgi:signal transduction histidine kinase/ligand-binding sensor domain-containing protein/CheY-like chemotaxis protein/HPt (histidine-containing phosphotransfer) domain-containing protein